MAYTEFRFDGEGIKQLLKERKEALFSNTGSNDFTGNAVKAFTAHLKKDPRRYRDFGPYWPALKEALRNCGGEVRGGEVFPEIAKVYRGNSNEETFVMAELFSSFYLKNFFLYTNNFLLDVDDDSEWYLYDPDYENPTI